MKGANTAQSIAFRCDGGPGIGVGHVGRCLPIADAFRQRGWQTAFVGTYSGMAKILLEASGHPTARVSLAQPCGVDDSFRAAILDCYELDPPNIAALARTRPVATIAESPSWPELAVHIDFHLDRIGATETERLLPGPKFAPVDPRFRQPPRASGKVCTILLTLGGGTAGHGLVPAITERIRWQFPAAEIVLPKASDRRCQPLFELVPGVDLAVCGAGFTAYELATAAIPALLIQLVANQERVVRGMTGNELALAVNVADAEFEVQLDTSLRRLDSPATRAELARRSSRVFDGRGAVRIVDGLISRGFGDS